MAGAPRGRPTSRLPYLRKCFLVSCGVAFTLQKKEAIHNEQKLL
jgi:hypothetical protein